MIEIIPSFGHTIIILQQRTIIAKPKTSEFTYNYNASAEG
jgi:hypothetical protein